MDDFDVFGEDIEFDTDGNNSDVKISASDVSQATPKASLPDVFGDEMTVQTLTDAQVSAKQQESTPADDDSMMVSGGSDSKAQSADPAPASNASHSINALPGTPEQFARLVQSLCGFRVIVTKERMPFTSPARHLYHYHLLFEMHRITLCTTEFIDNECRFVTNAPGLLRQKTSKERQPYLQLFNAFLQKLGVARIGLYHNRPMLMPMVALPPLLMQMPRLAILLDPQVNGQQRIRLHLKPSPTEQLYIQSPQ